MNIWKTEYLRYKYFFGTIFALEILLDLLRIFKLSPIISGVDTVYSFWQMLSWIAMVALVFFDFFSFFILNKDRLLHLLPVEKKKILQMKSIVLGTYMTMYFLLGLFRYLILLPEGSTNSILKVAVLYFINKVLAIMSFFSLLVAILTIIKKIRNKAIGAIVLAVLFSGVVSVQAYGLFQMVSIMHSVSWTIGIVDGANGINQYANILPIVFNEIGSTVHLAEENFYIVSLLLNAIVTILGMLISKILFGIQKFNYVES